MRALYVTWGEWGDGVFRTQVVDLVGILREQAHVDLAVLLSSRSRTRLGAVPGVTFLDGPLAGRWPLATFRLRSRGLSRMVANERPDVIHARGPLATIAADRVRGHASLIHDYRGLDALEVEVERGASRFTRRLARLEREACLRADAVSVVTEPLRQIVIDDYGVDPSRVTVNACGADVASFAFDETARDAGRRWLDVNGPVVVYVGSAAAWQVPELCVATAARVVAETDATFVVLSQDAQYFQELAQSHGIPRERLRVRAVSRDRLSQVLCAADVALLPRKPSPGNAIASPVKYAEYLAAGVPIVGVRGTGAFTTEIEERGLGALASEPDVDALVIAVKHVLEEGPEIRVICRRASAPYDLRAIATGYLSLYESLAA